MNLNLLTLNEKKTELSEASHFQSLFGWTKDIVCKIYFGMLSITLVLKFNLETELFLQVKRTFLLRCVHQKLAFLTHLIAYA